MERYNNIYDLCNIIREQLKVITKQATLAEDVNISLAAIKTYPPEQTITVTLAQTTVQITRDEALRLMQDKMNLSNAELEQLEFKLVKIRNILDDNSRQDEF